jgi:hypothetical protein
MKKIKVTFLLTFGFLIFRNEGLFGMQNRVKSEDDQESLKERIHVKSENAQCIITIENPISGIENPICYTKTLKEKTNFWVQIFSKKRILSLLKPCKSYITRKWLEPCKKSIISCLESCERINWPYAILAAPFLSSNMLPVGLQSCHYAKNK